MAIVGLDVAAVHELSSHLGTQAQHIHDVITAIDGLVNNTLPNIWHGPDAQEFTKWWHDTHRPAMSSAYDAVSGLSTSAKNNADEQDRTSGH